VGSFWSNVYNGEWLYSAPVLAVFAIGYGVVTLAGKDKD